MAKRKPPSSRQASSTSSGGAGLAIKLAMLGIVVMLVVYLLATNLTNEQSERSRDATAAGSVTNVDGAEAGAAAPSLPTDAPVAPVDVNPAAVEFGELGKNVIVTSQVKLTNTGSTPLRILDARPSCPCTTIQRQHTTIDPGRTITLELEMDSEARIGPKNVFVNVLFAGYQPVRIPLRATVVDRPT